MTARLALLALPVVLLGLGSGCTVTMETSGDHSFVEKVDDVVWTPGVTTARDVAEALGPPDSIDQVDNELWFTYRHRDIRGSRLALTYYGTFFTYQSTNEIDSVLYVWFDENDRLIAYGADQLPTKGGLTRFVR